MILKIHIQSLLDPFQGLRFYFRWKLHENAKQIYPIQFLRMYMIMVYLSGTVSMNFHIFLKIWLEKINVSIVYSVHKATY